VDSGTRDLKDYFSSVYDGQVQSFSGLQPQLLEFFWQHVPGRSGFAVTWACWDCQAFKQDLLWAPLSDAFLTPETVEQYPGASECGQRGYSDVAYNKECLRKYAFDHFSLQQVMFPGFFVRRRVDADASRNDQGDPPVQYWHGLPDNTWVEVMRISRLDFAGPPVRDEVPTCTVGQLWMWYAPGSGIWWNTGKSKRLLGHDKSNSIWWADSYRNHDVPPCKTALAQGYDSIQLTQFNNDYSFEVVDCRGANLPDAGKRYELSCHAPHMELIVGLPTKRYAPALVHVKAAIKNATRPCKCDPLVPHINCAR
jgi:hypothetical protein